MKWLPGGWQRSENAEHETTPRRTTPYPEWTAKIGNSQAEPATKVQSGTPGQSPAKGPTGATGLAPDAQDVDVSATSFRTLLIGGGISGLLTVLCAAALVNNGASPTMWLWQLLFGVIFLWFITASRGMLASRGFLFDRSGFYVRTKGEVFGVPWTEVGAVGVGSLRWIENKRPVHPERRQALEIYPADPAFPDRHPEFDRWLVEESAPMPGLPGLRYRFHLPPINRLARHLERATQTVAPRKWVGQYRRHQPPRPQ
jgi:hypothetical protein